MCLCLNCNQYLLYLERVLLSKHALVPVYNGWTRPMNVNVGDQLVVSALADWAYSLPTAPVCSRADE